MFDSAIFREYSQDLQNVMWERQKLIADMIYDYWIEGLRQIIIIKGGFPVQEKSKESVNNLFLENAFVDVIEYIFVKAGYYVQREVKYNDIVFDLMAQNKKTDMKYVIEAKYMTNSTGKTIFSIEYAISSMAVVAERENLIPILVMTGVLDNSTREQYNNRYSNLIIIDTANLLFIAQNDQKSYDLIVSSLPGVINEIEPKKPDESLELLWLNHSDEFKEISNAFETCPIGKNGARLFEKACFSALRYAFSEDLTLWKEQARANANLFRFDLICRIKDGNQKSFWMIMERFFQTKYVLFEFKNYRAKITQGEVFTTEKYLYPKALRKVGIIVSTNGASKQAKHVARGIFRETGKLILLLSKEQLLWMCEMRKNGDDPSNYLINELDQLLLELEK